MSNLKVKYLILFLFLSTLLSNAFAQKNDELFKVGSEKVTVDEFKRVYEKNATNKKIDYSESSVNEYLDLYINFKLKVLEAKAQGLDTVQRLQKELQSYRKQLSESYLVDKQISEELLLETYDRMGTLVKASHILVAINPEEDTIVAYNKIMDIKKQLEEGADFAELAVKYSDDPSAKDYGGNLGYFSAMQMVYPFENAAFNTKVGELSNIVKTRFGYHILKVFDKKSNPGEINVQHILIRTKKDDPNAEATDLVPLSRINKIYEQLQEGKDFTELAKQVSEDKGSASKGGQLPLFGHGKMFPEFEKAAFDLKTDGEYSKPVKTPVGYHIIKRINMVPMKSYEDMKKELVQKVKRDARSQVSKVQFITRLKKQYNFKLNENNRSEFYNELDESLLAANWNGAKHLQNKSTLFTLDGNKYTNGEFASFIANSQYRTKFKSKSEFLKAVYTDFEHTTILNYEEQNLENTNEEFKRLLGEYSDGILLFELMEQKVWNKASKDTLGQQEFYSKNKQNYVWNDAVRATVYHSKDLSTALKIKELRVNNHPIDSIKSKINQGKVNLISITSKGYEKGKDPTIDGVIWKKGNEEIVKNDDGTVKLVVIEEVLNKKVKSLQEAKGYVIADYQDELEKNWMLELREKYGVTVNNKALKKLID